MTSEKLSGNASKAKRQVTAALHNLTPFEKLTVLVRALAEIAQPNSAGALSPMPRRRRLTKVEGDQALQSFVDEVQHGRPLLDIVELCRQKFGPTRAPSKSSLDRYLRRRRADQWIERQINGGGRTNG